MWGFLIDQIIYAAVYTIMKRVITFILISYMFISGCANGLQKMTSENEGLVYEYFVDEQDQKQGDYIVKHPDGHILEKAIYQDDQLTDRRILFYSNGSPELIEHYKNGLFHGIYTSYYDNGSKKYEVPYVDNVMTGIYTGYYTSGHKKEEVTFAHNEENGPFTEYYENGQKKWEGTYKNGENEVGLLLNYNEEGELIKKMMCDDQSICITTWSIDNQ